MSGKKKRKMNTTEVPSSAARSAKWYRETMLFQELRLQEKTWQEIADLASSELGYNVSLSKVRKRVTSQWAERVALAADDAVAHELAVLGLAQAATLDLLNAEPIEVQNSKGDTLGFNYSAKATGIGHLTRLSESRRKLLGLDKPAKSEVTMSANETALDMARALRDDLGDAS